MPISAELEARYSSEVDVDWCDALIISHSSFSTLYICNTIDGFMGIVPSEDGTSSISAPFVPVPFSVVLPMRDDSGTQEMSIAISNIGLNAQNSLNLAIQTPEEPIKIRYTIYIIPKEPSGDLEPQYDPLLTLTMTDITVALDVVTATATRSDVLNLHFPLELYRPEYFPGLSRR